MTQNEVLLRAVFFLVFVGLPSCRPQLGGLVELDSLVKQIF